MSQINVGFDNNSPQSIERSTGKLVQGRTVPYSSIAEAVAAVASSYRYRGKTVSIDDGTGMIEYWWRLGTGDGQLVPKVLTEQVIEFIVGDGGTFTPIAGTMVYPGGTNPGILVNCAITMVGGDLGILCSKARSNGFQSYQYDKVAGTITLVNASFSNATYWMIKYRQI